MTILDALAPPEIAASTATVVGEWVCALLRGYRMIACTHPAGRETSTCMSLAPIRGAPPGAPNPDFPAGQPTAEAAPPSATPAAEQPPVHPTRQQGTPISIVGTDSALTFTVIPEIPAIRRASMTIHAIANAAAPSATDTLGSLQMSAPRAREFLTDLRNGRSPIIATGDEGGTVQINYAVTTAGAVFSVHRPGERQAVCQCAVDPTCDMGFTCDELLADLGA